MQKKSVTYAHTHAHTQTFFVLAHTLNPTLHRAIALFRYGNRHFLFLPIHFSVATVGLGLHIIMPETLTEYFFGVTHELLIKQSQAFQGLFQGLEGHLKEKRPTITAKKGSKTA